MKTFSDFGIEIPGGRTSGKVKMLCPHCHEQRKNKRDKSLSVDLDKGVWHCHYCSWSGTIHVGERSNDTPKKEYRRPTPRPITELSRRLVDWFNSRGISELTLKKMRINEGRKFMPQDGKEMNTVQFNYYLNGELINVKYRTGSKHFMLESGAELIPYNLDGITGEKECIITEGEMDCLSFVEIGKTNCISVPNGANANLTYLDDFIDGWFEDKETIYIAVDTDTKGVLLRDELVRRFGSERCKIVTYGDDCKDANEHLQKYGKESLEKCLRGAADVKVDGVFSLNDYEDELDGVYEHGLQPGFKVGHPNFDALCTFETKRLAVVTGIPGCLDGDTLVLMADGTRKPIREVEIGERVATMDIDHQMTTADITYKWDSGVKECHEMTLTNGTSIVATKDHKFYTFNGWKPLGAITENDWVLVPENIEQNEYEEITDDQIKLLAYWIANGNKHTSAYVVTTYSEAIVNELKTICNRNHLTLSNNTRGEFIIGSRRGLSSSRREYISKMSCHYRKKKGMNWNESFVEAEKEYERRIAEPKSTFIPYDMIKLCGLDGINTCELRLPEICFKFSNRQLAILLNRLFACDGSTSPNTIEYSSISKQLCLDVAEMLRRFGLMTSVNLKHGKYNGQDVISYRVNLHTHSERLQFAKKIGMIGKDIALTEHLNLPLQSRRGRMIPGSIKNALLHSNNYYFDAIHVHPHLERNGNNNCASKELMLECLKLDGLTHLYNKVNGGQWTRIKSIRPVGNRHTYDIEVAATHNFITNCVTSNSGKSEFIDEMCVRFNIFYNFKVAFFSPENMPIEYHAVKLIEKLCGKRLKSVNDIENITQSQYAHAKEYYRDNFFHILPEDGYTVDNILVKAKYLIRKRGIKILVIDPFNRIENAQDVHETETQYISKVLDKLTNFAQQNDVLIFLMAHPRKVNKDVNKGVPTLYDINGSANFYNKADFGIIVHRERENKDYTLVRVEKVKFRHLGHIGDATFKFNVINGRYIPWNPSESVIVNFQQDMDDFIVAKERGTISQPSLPDTMLPWDNLESVPVQSAQASQSSATYQSPLQQMQAEYEADNPFGPLPDPNEPLPF